MGEEQRLSAEEQLASARDAFEHGTDFAMALAPTGGYEWRGGRDLRPLADVTVETHAGGAGIPVAARWQSN